MRLNELRDNRGARRGRKRLGRGMGSGLGKTSGQGHKGHKARSGGSAHAEGGQTPINRRLPKRGFKAAERKRFGTVNLKAIARAIEGRRLETGEIITEEALVAAGLARKGRAIRLLGHGEISQPIKICVYYATAGAQEKLKEVGGEVISYQTLQELEWREAIGGDGVRLRAWINNEQTLPISTGEPFTLSLSIRGGEDIGREVEEIGKDVTVVLASKSVSFDKANLSLWDIYAQSQRTGAATIEGVTHKKGKNEIDIMLYFDNNYLRGIKKTIASN